MKGDFTRDTFKPDRHYQQVLLQQGRVQLDADWNEQSAIAARRDQTTAADLVGDCGGPAEGAAFAVITDQTTLDGLPIADLPAGTVPVRQLGLSAGRYYVDGIQCEVESPFLFSWQPDRRRNEPLPSGNQYLLFLDVWQRHVTLHEDSDIREAALGGPDTATRLKTVWQVRAAALNTPLDLNNPPADPCHQLATAFEQRQRKALPRLAAKTTDATPETDPCTVPASAGYRGLENQLYRVEIHQSGALGIANFKWSRENGSVVTRIHGHVVVPVNGVNVNRLTVTSTGPDDQLGFKKGNLVELIHDSEELEATPGALALVEQVDDATGTITLTKFGSNPMPVVIDLTSNPRLRRWDGFGLVVVNLAVNNGFVPLENGIEIQFELPAGAEFRTGDYWQIPARTASPDAQSGRIEFPSHGGIAAFLPPKGIAHHYCRLGVVSVSSNGAVTLISDCRCLWPALTTVPRLFYVSGDGQEVMPDLSAAAGARFQLPRPLIVGMANAHCLERAMKVRFAVLGPSTGQVAAAGGPPASNSTDVELSTDGLAPCDFHLDGVHATQTVMARLLDLVGNPVSSPVIFNANLSIAGQVAYQPGDCAGLAGQFTVQAAIDRLVEQVSIHKVSGDAQTGLAGQPLPQAVEVQVANRCGPVEGVPVQFTVRSGGGSVSTPQRVVTGSDGRAACRWILGNSTATQELEAAIDGKEHPTAAPVRVRFTAQLPTAASAERGVRIKGVLLLGAGAGPLRLGMLLPVNGLQPGLRIDCDRDVDAATVSDGGTFSNQRVTRGEPTCFVTVEVPIPLSRDQIAFWGDQGLVGYTPVVLAADVRVEGSQIIWLLSPQALAGLQRALGQMSQLGGRFGDRILARLTLKGNFIWGLSDDGGERRDFLDGETFRIPAGINANQLQLPSGDDRRGGDFEMWFWLAAVAN